MALVLEILLGVLILASIGIAFLSARNWPIYQAVLVVFIMIGSAVFFYLGARTLATHNAWGKYVKERQDELARIESDTRNLVDGVPESPGVPAVKGLKQLQADLEKLIVNRGGALFEVAVEGVKDGVVQVKFAGPTHGLVPGNIVFAFDEAPKDQGGRYRGEFKVESVSEDGTSVSLAPNLPLSETQANELAAVKGPWTLYASMPVDDAAVFAGLDDAARQALVPESAAEFASLERPLRDYETFFHESFVQQSLLKDAINKTNSDLTRTADAAKRANDEITYRTAESGNLRSDLEKFQHEEKVIAAYQQSLVEKFQQVRESLKATYAKNKQLAAQVTAAQLKAAEQINQAASVR